MYGIADDNLLNDDLESDSDEECQILEERLVKPPVPGLIDLPAFFDSLVRDSVINVRKRPAPDSPRSPREATGFKQPALQVSDSDDEVELPSSSESSPIPTTSQNLVQSLSPGHLSIVVQSNQSLPQVPSSSMYQPQSGSMQQPIHSCMPPIPIKGPQCAHNSSVQSCHLPMCGCNSLARPIPMRPSGLISSPYPPQSSCTSGELPGSNGLTTNPPQPSSSPQQRHDSSTLPSHSLNQPSLSCISLPFLASPFIRTQCTSILNSHKIASPKCTVTISSTSSPQTNNLQEVFEQPQPSNQVNDISSITQPSQENNSASGGNSPVHGGQAALDLSSPLQEQSPRNPAAVAEKRPIWQGTLHYEEKAVNLSDPNVSHFLACTFSALMNANVDSDLDVNLWPFQMSLSLIASEILKEKNMFEVLKSAAHHVVINFHEESQVLKRIKRNMNHGWMGCVQFTIPTDVRIMIVHYMPQEKVYVGFIPYEQKVFFNTFRHVYEKKRRIRNIQKQLQAGTYLSGCLPASPSVSTTMGLNEQSRNQFEEIDNEIDAHISALHRRHQEAQPSTSYQQPGSSHSASNHSIEARLKRLEAAQKGSTNVNEYEDIDNEINRHIAAHWVRHYSQNASSSTSQQTKASCPLPNLSYTNACNQLIVDELKRIESSRNTSWQVLQPSTFKPFLFVERFAGADSGGGTHTAGLITQSSKETASSEDENSVESQASEIFGKDLVQKIVQKKLKDTGKRFYTVQELCDEILKYEESQPKPVGEKSKKQGSEDVLCKICLDQRMSIVFEPCRHLATCEECAKPLTKCPMCRTIVRKKMRIFVS